MADGIIQVPPDSTGKKVDAASMDVGASTVYRQRIVIGDNSATAQFAIVTGGALLVTQSGAINISAMPTVTVTGGVAISGTVVLAAGVANIGSINNISAAVALAAGTALIGAVSLGAGTANIGFINGISATVNVLITAGTNLIGAVSNAAGTALMGAVSLAAGTANIGFINGISAPVALAAGTNNIGFINNISAPVALAAGSANIGSINNISATTIVALGITAIISASHGPRCVTASTSSNVTLIASPGVGQSIYITQLAVSNAGAAGSRARIGTSSSLATIVMFCASAGGGFVLNFDPPWKLSASEAAICSVKPNTSDALFNVNFYVAP